ncbi:DNA topoisomerase [Zopfochytrium polystomum]|nr:DNA topoisomerase [Zopfochytrium polystomum]
MKVLCVAEKPSVAKAVAGILSGNHYTVRPSPSKFNLNYVFPSTFEGTRCEVVMTSVTGHLFGLDFPPEYKRWAAIPIDQCFTAPVIQTLKEDEKKIKGNLSRQAEGATAVVIWTDCDLEGENIGSEVVRACQERNRRIQVKRARFSVIQEREIQAAWRNLGELDMLQAAAVDARCELDLRIGAAFTRLQTLNLAQRFPQIGQGQIISYGSCQFPTLGFIVEQFERVKSFTPELFWKIDLTLSKNAATQKFTWRREHLFDHQFALSLYEMCVANPEARIVSVNSRPKEKWRPLPLTTVELLKACSTKFRIPSHETMRIAEKLYTSGIISYPRTETDMFDENFNLRELLEIQAVDNRWGEHAQGLLNGKFTFPRRGQHNDKAHPPIHPTKATNDLGGNDARVFEYITRRFLACCSDNAKGQETSVVAEVAGESFSASGLLVLERNYLDVYPYDKWATTTIPAFEVGERIEPTSLLLNQGSTIGPKLLTEAELIAKMEQAGIGTDATIHDHIAKVQEREYANKENEYFFPTTLGMGLVLGYKKMDMVLSLSKPHLRSHMEAGVKSIANGTRSKAEMLEENIRVYSEAFRVASTKFHEMEAALHETFGL